MTDQQAQALVLHACGLLLLCTAVLCLFFTVLYVRWAVKPPRFFHICTGRVVGFYRGNKEKLYPVVEILGKEEVPLVVSIRSGQFHWSVKENDCLTVGLLQGKRDCVLLYNRSSMMETAALFAAAGLLLGGVSAGWLF